MRRVVCGFAVIPAVFEGNNLSCWSAGVCAGVCAGACAGVCAGACANNIHTAFYYFSCGRFSELCSFNVVTNGRN